MPSDGFASRAGSCSSGVSVVNLTVISSIFSTVMPARRKFGLASSIPLTRSMVKMTSSASMGLPSEKTRPSSSVKVNSVASSFCSQLARPSTGVVTSEPSKSTRVS